MPHEAEIPLLAVGSTIEWTAEEFPDEFIRRAGPYSVRITKTVESDLTAPVVEVSSGDQKVIMEGSHAQPTYTHRLSVIQNVKGAVPVLMFQSFSGGAHCCNAVKLAGFSSGKLKVVDLGSWDGDEIEIPKDFDGDGLADFVLFDNAFLYAFASYAASYAPPKILNVQAGKVIDVSRKAGFRKLYLKFMSEAGKRCRTGSSSDERNGACPAYVASAARIGKLEQAWGDMVAAYDPATGWDLPAGCRVRSTQGCPPGQEIQFKSYPEALLQFLKQHGYVPSEWQPPEFFEPARDEPSDDETAQTI